MNSLYIGLGGIGCRALKNLMTQQQELTYSNDKFVFIDTDERELSSVQPSLPSNRVFTLFLGDESLDKMLACHRDAQNWFDASKTSQNLNEGSGANRQYARLAFLHHIEDIRRTLIPILRDVYTNHGRIYVVTSAFGGTGSGICLDLLYLIDKTRVFMGNGWDCFDVRLILAVNSTLSWDFEPHIVHYFNQFASLSELNAVCKDVQSSPSHFEKFYVKSDLLSPNEQFHPFTGCYLFDGPYMNWAGEVIPQLTDVLIHLELIGYNGADMSIKNAVRSDLGNSIMNNNKFARAFCSVGCFSIEKSDFLYKEYFTNRLLFDVFHKGLLGSADCIDKTSVEKMAQEFLYKIDIIVTETSAEISNTMISKEDFSNETVTKILFSAFTKNPIGANGKVGRLMKRKDKMLIEIRDTIYGQCWKWLHDFDFATVLEVLQMLDKRLYFEAYQSLPDISNSVFDVMDYVHGFFGNFKKGKAFEVFNDVLKKWLYYETNKALSSGRGDLEARGYGYLDVCKEFVRNATEMHLPEQYEQWESCFTKEVAQLKLKDNKCFIPSLDTITDDTLQVNPNLAHFYEKAIIVEDEDKASYAKGTCTPSSLHRIILERMSADKDLKYSGTDIDQLFDPTPERNNSLNDQSATRKFLEAYMKIVEQVVEELISNNPTIQDYLAENIVSRLLKLSDDERHFICKTYAEYDKTNFCAMPIPPKGFFVYCITDYDPSIIRSDLEGALGINTTPYCTIVNTPACRDKIVKLVVRTGYGVNESRAYDYSAKISEQLLVDSLIKSLGNPFIDKRFLTDRKDGESLADMFLRESE